MQMHGYMLPSGFPSPQAGLLTGSRVIPVEPIEGLNLFILLPQHLHCGGVVRLLLGVVLHGVLDVLGKSGLNLPRFVEVFDSEVDVMEASTEVAVPSS